MRVWWLLAALFLSCASGAGQAQYRAFWADTFNTALNNHNDIVNVVNQLRAAKCNAIFAQVRRRGDAWYLNAVEPKPDFVNIAAGFDPLADLIAEAHANGIEVHAFVIMGAAWNKNPTLPPSATGGPPTTANHVFNLHGNFNAATGLIDGGPNNWLTRTLLPDQTGITFGGYRFGNDFWLDFGHPGAAEYSVEALMHLVRSYNIDGLHLDRIRYPELNVAGQTPSTGISIGYNDTSVARFQRRYGLPAGTPPAQNDANWVQWRRDQVTNLVRRIYLNSVAIKPQLKVSAALIAFGNGPTTEASWNSAESYWRVYQDWRAWTEEGILDLAIPMVYKTEHTAAGATSFDQWAEWTKNHQYNRAALMGNGNLLNAIEGTLRQTRRAFTPSTMGNTAKGVVFFSQATNNVAVTANPHSFPPNQNTPARAFAEFASGLTTGRSQNGATQYEDTTANPTAVFANAAPIPALPWKTNPTQGHLMGFIFDENGQPVDAGAVVIERIAMPARKSKAPTPNPQTPFRTTVNTATDGGGFYGGVDLDPGTYRVTVTPVGQAPFIAPNALEVRAGQVTRLNVNINRSGVPFFQFGANGFQVTESAGLARVSVARTGAFSGEAAVDFAVTDGTAQQRTDYTITSGTLNFGANEARKDIELLIVDDVYDEAHETVTITLSNANGAALSGPSSITLTILDNDNQTPTTNPLDAAQFFVNQHYLDFLSRAPDAGGLEFWTGQITLCGADAACLNRRRIDVSAAFFVELEFQESGAFVYRLYRAAFGNQQPFPNPDAGPPGGSVPASALPSYAKFSPDRARVVGGATLEAGKLAFANLFAGRGEFTARYPVSQTPAQFVDAVLATVNTASGLAFDAATRQSFINDAANSRGLMLKNLADNAAFKQAEFNRGFVLTQYFGYLRRDPDIAGYNFWLGVINGQPQNIRGMVCAFITSAEYQQRFSSVATRSNNDCNNL
jgi:uncharacterized lipoprotein YddW (UPF0748 family)